MKNLFLIMALCAISISSAFSLEPLNVAIINTNAGPHNLTVEVNDYNTGSAVNIYSEVFNGLTPNSSGVITFTLGVGSVTWTGIAASSVTSYYIIDVKIGATLYAQYRLDELIRMQAQTGVSDNNGNIIPNENDASTLGTDSQRWKDVYVGPASFHIGESGDEASISYATGTNTLTLTADVTKASADLIVDGSTTLGDDNTSDAHTVNGKTAINNDNTTATNAALTLTNDDVTNESFSLNIKKGQVKYSITTGVNTIDNNDPIVIGNKTIIRLKSLANANISGNVLSNGTAEGQILYITNENGGEIDLDDTNFIGTAKIAARSVLQIIWNGSNWMVINRY